jgi:ABC-type multidrug transport system ATPase subunit
VAQVRLSEVSKRWGAEPAVDNVSFTAEAGSLVVLLGPSGCGKSTTLRLIAGLESADEGTIEIAGRDVTHAPPARRGTAMVFQNARRCRAASEPRRGEEAIKVLASLGGPGHPASSDSATICNGAPPSRANGSGPEWPAR